MRRPHSPDLTFLVAVRLFRDNQAGDGPGDGTNARTGAPVTREVVVLLPPVLVPAVPGR